MKFLKGLGVAFFGFLLSISLVVFGLVFTINSTVLSPGFVTREISEVNVAALLEQLATQTEAPQGEGPPKELVSALTDTVRELEPLLKERLNAVVVSTYDYLLGRKPNPDLTLTLRNTVLKKDFFLAVVDKLDIAAFARQLLKQQLGSGQVPPEFQKYVDPALDKVIGGLKPWMKQQIEIAADPLLDYLLGLRDSFRVAINTDTLRTSLLTSIRETVLLSPPPELAALPPAEREMILNQFLPGLERALSGMIPPTIELDEKMLGTEMRARIIQGITEAEGKLIEARQFITYSQTAYKALIAIILVSTAGIILIQRQVRGASRTLGVIFLVYGAIAYAVALVGKNVVRAQLVEAMAEVPPTLQSWVMQLSDRLLAPLATFSLAVLIAGAALLVLSFVYPKRTGTG
ncbi:MAG: hypothetical protein HYX85_00790 [Chloroflexi bacterium]|nr:hypothetical protein [Chloroflexota bacterium]